MLYPGPPSQAGFEATQRLRRSRFHLNIDQIEALHARNRLYELIAAYPLLHLWGQT